MVIFLPIKCASHGETASQCLEQIHPSHKSFVDDNIILSNTESQIQP